MPSVSGHGNATLYRQYLRFNRLYFGDKLPADILIYWEPNIPVDAAAETCPVYEVAHDKFKITMDPAIQDLRKYWKICLLHEMIHVKLWRTNPKHQHGKLFQGELRRIMELGAYKNLL